MLIWHSSSEALWRRTPCVRPRHGNNCAIGKDVQGRRTDIHCFGHVPKARRPLALHSSVHESRPPNIVYHRGFRRGYLRRRLIDVRLFLSAFQVQLGQNDRWRPLHQYQQIVCILQHPQSIIRCGYPSVTFASTLEAPNTSKHQTRLVGHFHTRWVVSLSSVSSWIACLRVATVE